MGSSQQLAKLDITHVRVLSSCVAVTAHDLGVVIDSQLSLSAHVTAVCWSGYYHISPVLRQLHWLPVRQRVHFKVATFAHQSLSGISPSYLADDCRLVADARERRLRSTASRTCVVTRTYSTFGDRAFWLLDYGTVFHRTWNTLTYHPMNSGSRWRHFCLDSGATAQCKLY